MLASVVVFTIVLASLWLAHSAQDQRSGRRMRFETIGINRSAAAGMRREGFAAAAVGARPAEVAFVRSDSWRYYGFSMSTPEADAAVVGSACVADTLAIGSIVSTLPDDTFVTEVNGRAYRRCGNVWFQPEYTGSDVTYVVVHAP
jgi:hypothetical protein